MPLAFFSYYTLIAADATRLSQDKIFQQLPQDIFPVHKRSSPLAVFFYVKKNAVAQRCARGDGVAYPVS
jgi:hypothetical protein